MCMLPGKCDSLLPLYFFRSPRRCYEFLRIELAATIGPDFEIDVFGNTGTGRHAPATLVTGAAESSRRAAAPAQRKLESGKIVRRELWARRRLRAMERVQGMFP